MLLLRQTLSIVVTLALSLWLGGLISLFLAVTTLFHTFASARPRRGWRRRGSSTPSSATSSSSRPSPCWRRSAGACCPSAAPPPPGSRPVCSPCSPWPRSRPLPRRCSSRRGSTRCASGRSPTARSSAACTGRRCCCTSGEAAVLLLAGVLLPSTVARDQAGVGAAGRATRVAGIGPTPEAGTYPLKGRSGQAGGQGDGDAGQEEVGRVVVAYMPSSCSGVNTSGRSCPSKPVAARTAAASYPACASALRSVLRRNENSLWTNVAEPGGAGPRVDRRASAAPGPSRSSGRARTPAAGASAAPRPGPAAAPSPTAGRSRPTRPRRAAGRRPPSAR